ncbi:MAG: hypothetical protein Q8L79_19965 [Methylobacter sp.]|uniref:hypothetical protein n=1 Tax=Methylobacter sp. TaxID=2051955 RepID=UPI002731DE36|nr:hypothetical protein [Methylobacter sp.]MDP1667388.1 hypothetical protein [Methylobacter sp.]
MNVPNVSDTDELGRRRASDELGRRRVSPGVQMEALPAQASAVSWGSIVAGATAAAALALILTMLGTGLGLSSVSPWAYSGISAEAFGISTILWLTITQLIAAGVGGYLAGRLRTKWIATDADEVYFRDTAHGFLAWAVSALMTAALLTSMIGSIVSGGIQAGSTAAAVTAGSAAAAGVEVAKYTGDNEPMKYFMDSLFRRDINTAPLALTPDETGVMPTTDQELSPAESTSEITRIFANTLRTGPLPPEDVRYVGQVVAQRTGLTQQEAEKRVVDTYTQAQAKLREAEIAAKEAVDTTRKASVYASLWFFISLLIGAFCASYAATYGGRQRDL